MIKRFYILLLAIVASVGMSWASVITWNASKVSSMAMYVSSGSDSRTSDGITVTAVSTGEFVVFGDHGGAIEIGNGEGSGGGYLTFTSSVGNIAQIDINHSGAGEWRNANGDWISPYYENFEGGIFTWSGTPAASVTLTGDAPRHIDDITSIEFTIEDGGGSTPASDEGKLSGAFSVSGTKVVYFSKGNLQATTSDQGATWTWGFAENQWDYVGDAAANTSFDYWGGKGNGSYDLFGWIGASSALTDYRQYGIGSNYDFTDCGSTAGENLKAEWGSLMGSDWRTLTYDEWQYLIKNRNNAANLLAYATVNGKTGLILLPDSWTSSSVALTITTANYTTNIISASDWSTLEEQGCVFLPAAGSREDSSVSGVGAGGDYWSSSSPSGKQYDEGNAYCFFFDTDFSKQADGMHFNKRGRGYGLSVRLVTETAPAAPAYETVMNLINAIGTVELTAECKAKIDAARAAFDALSDGDKAQVTNYSTLQQAETDYAALAAAAAAPVIAQIEALPTTIKLSTYFSTYDLMVAARAAYNTLSAEVQAAVTNLSKLTNLEAAFAAIGGVNEKLSKPFSVGEGQVVYFSHGNLQATYNGTNWSWAFAAHQYDYIGDTSGNIIINGNGTLSGAGTVDLFGWVANSSTVLTSGVAKYGVSNSDNVSDYGLGTTETLKGDWGVAANDANIGGYNDWRILSKDEWVYLFKTRTDAASKYGYATVGGVNGVIIIPDAFTDPMKNKGNKAFIPQNVDKGYSTNVYTTGGDWEAMEAAGAVFMPAAGRRYGTTMTVNEGTGFYWSSTPMSYQASYFMGFMGSNVVPDNDRYRSHGLSVRLVSNNAPVVSTPLEYALAAVALINAIPTPVTLDDACKDAIDAARAAVDALGANASLIDDADMNKLTQAETDYADLKTAADQAAADSVIAKINAIPSPMTSENTKLSVYQKVQDARAAYDALTDDQKALVSNIANLTAAEDAFAAIGGGGGVGFTINAEGDKITFAPGNLQGTYSGTNWNWAFAAHQWDYIGNASGNTTIQENATLSSDGTFDLFGWVGASSNWTGLKIYGITSSKAYNNVDGYGNIGNDALKGDWSDLANSAELGGRNDWRMLTAAEWDYLFRTRTNAALLFGLGTVNGVNGMIMLPDNWTTPDGATFVASTTQGLVEKSYAFVNDNGDNFTHNTYTTEQWSVLEAAGAIFLPAAGYREGTTMKEVGTHGNYWTANAYEKSRSINVRFENKYFYTAYNDYRCDGQSIRLAAPVAYSPIDAAQAAVDLINAIPDPVTLDEACVKAIKDAREAVTALGEASSLIDAADMTKLTKAEADYTALIQAGADAVIAKIANIPQPVTLKLATRDSIESARAAYDALTADQQALVSNYDVLTAAETALAALNPGGGAPAGALNGKFTINAEGDQIAFSKGNLQATTEDLGEHWTWGFAANQWNYLGIAVANSKINGNGTVSENGTVDLFGWSTAATYYGINNSYKAVDYIGDFVDWGPNMGAGWRTLTKDEWNYLIENNTKGRATVNDKNGYIFLPNDWSGPAFTPNPDNFTTNVYSGDDWTAMENAGAVFLPSGPARNGTYALIANDAKYSSSTSLNNDTSYVFTIYYNQSQSACTGTNRAYGCMVRLVSEGGGATPLDSAQAVKDLIEAIPVPVTLDDACVNAVQAARDAYDALSEATQGALDAATVKKLTDAEAALTALNQAEADKAIAKINNIPTPVELKLATRDSIQNARTAYDALNAAQQALVTNYQTLLDAEAALAELNKGGSTPVDIVWDGNTGIANVSPTTTSPAYEGMTVTVGQGSSFSTYQSRLYFTFNSQPNGGFIFANENGTNITKVVIESTSALTSTMTEVDRMGSGWVISNENKTATWTGNTDSVSIWKGEHFANYWVVDMITFTVNGTATPLDSAQAVKDLIDAIPTPVEYPTSGPAIAAALVAYNQLSDAAKGALDAADVQKMTDAAIQYAALDAIAAIEAIPAEIVYDPAVKAAIETAREKYDALIDASKALVDAEVVAKLTNAEQAWADLVALIEHTVTYIGKDGELKNEKVALLHIPNPAPEFNGYEFVRWDVKAGDFLEEGLRIKAVYTPIITTDPVAFDTLVYNGTAQTLIEAGVASDGHIEYRLNDGEWSDELPQAEMAAAYVVDYKLVREGHEDYMAGSVTAVIAKAPVTYTAPTAVETLVYNASNQTLIAAGQTKDGIFEYSLDPTLLDSWKTDLPQAMNAGTYNVYFRVNGDMNHLDSTAVDPIAVTIAKAELTATADDKNVIYGDAVPEYSVTYAGWQGDDDAAVLTGDIAFACEYASTSNVGEYTITPSGVSAKNYTITFVDGKLTVSKAASSCEAPVAFDTLVYNGFAQTLIEAGLPTGGEMQYSLDTTLLGSWSTELPQAKDAGAYKVFYRVKGDLNHNDKGYDQPVELSIAQADLMITAEDKSVIYGDAVPEFTATYEGWKGSDDVSVVSGLTFTCEYAPTSNVGEYTIVPSGATALNYAISYTNGKVTVGKAALMITAEDKSVIYGDAVPEYTATFEGWKNSDDELVVSGLTFTCEYAPTSNVGEYTIVPSGATALNYAISYTNGKLTVFKGTLTITANDTVVIYGDEAPAFTASYSGWLNGDDESVVSGLAFTTPYQPGSPVGTYAIQPVNATADNYQINFVEGTLTVNKAIVSVSGAEAQTAKFADGHTGAEVLNAGTLNGIKLNDPLTHVTTAVFSSAEVSEHLTITLFYELTGDAALLANYDLQSTSEVFTTEGVIIEPFLPNNDDDPEDKESKVQEGIEVYAYGYCEGDNVGLKYHLNSGNPDQYKIEFEDSRFADVDWTLLDEKGPEGVIYITVPVDIPTGDYKMTVTFRDSRFAWLESQPLSVTFHVNLPETYVRPLFDNTIVLVDTCECFTDIQWYHRADASEQWQPISGANGHYLHVEGKLTGEYFVKAKMNGVETYTCEQTDMQTLYGAETNKQAKVKAYPNPVIDNTNVTIENSEAWEHNLRIVNLMGVEMNSSTFEGDHTVVEMSGYPQGNYMISVDGIMVKVLKQ